MLLRFLKIWAWMLFLGIFAAYAADRKSVSVEDAFWAYDDGKIGYEELEELLLAIDEDARAACDLWESYGGDPCKKGLAELLSDAGFHGALGYRISIDSASGIRSERLRFTASAGRFDGGFRMASERRKNVRVENWRVRYRDKRSFSVLGNITAADIGSAVSLSNRLGNVTVAGTGKFRLGTVLLADSSLGGVFTVGSKGFSVSGFGNGSFEGFQNAFLRVRAENLDLQTLYSRGWKTPVLYFSAKSGKGSVERIRFRGYFHKNSDTSGIFRIPRTVRKNRAVGTVSGSFPLSNLEFRLGGKIFIPLDSLKARSEVEAGLAKSSPHGRLSVGSRVRIFGDSVNALPFLRSGIRLFSAESLFCEWKADVKFPSLKSLYEIRPGVRISLDERAFVTALLIVRRPGEKPLVFRGESLADVSKYFFFRNSVELRGARVREMRLWRFGLEVGGKW